MASSGSSWTVWSRACRSRVMRSETEPSGFVTALLSAWRANGSWARRRCVSPLMTIVVKSPLGFRCAMLIVHLCGPIKRRILRKALASFPTAAPNMSPLDCPGTTAPSDNAPNGDRSGPCLRIGSEKTPHVLWDFVPATPRIIHIRPSQRVIQLLKEPLIRSEPRNSRRRREPVGLQQCSIRTAHWGIPGSGGSLMTA